MSFLWSGVILAILSKSGKIEFSIDRFIILDSQHEKKRFHDFQDENRLFDNDLQW